VLAVAALALPTLPGAGEESGNRDVLAALLGAQGGLAAIALAVTVFLTEAVHRREDVDDLVFRTFVGLAYLRFFFSVTIASLAATAVALLLAQPSTAPSLDGVRNLTFLAGAAFGVSLAAVTGAFLRMLDLIRPHQWTRLLATSTEREMETATGAFIARLQGVESTNDETAAEEAVQRILGEAVRAVRAGRYIEFETIMGRIKILVSQSVRQIRGASIRFSPPGVYASFPITHELRLHFGWLRGVAMKAGWNEFGREVWFFDEWLVRQGVRERSGELFSLGFEGFQRTYEHAVIDGDNHVRRICTSRCWDFGIPDPLEDLAQRAFQGEDLESLRFLRWMARPLSDYLLKTLETPAEKDFVAVSRKYEEALETISLGFSHNLNATQFSATQELQQMYRVTLLGLAGRLVIEKETDALAASLGELSRVYPSLDRLLTDCRYALAEAHESDFPWRSWESEELPRGGGAVHPERYPLAGFTLLARRLVDEGSELDALAEDLPRVIKWIEENPNLLDGV
jgi:hypothetical protein